MGVEVMSEQHENKLEELERVEYNRVESRVISGWAKSLCYPISDITVKLSSLASECDLEEEMEDYLDEVRQIQNKLESAFFRCEEVFSNRISSLECELLDMEDKESEHD